MSEWTDRLDRYVADWPEASVGDADGFLERFADDDLAVHEAALVRIVALEAENAKLCRDLDTLNAAGLSMTRAYPSLLDRTAVGCVAEAIRENATQQLHADLAAAHRILDTIEGALTDHGVVVPGDRAQFGVAVRDALAAARAEVERLRCYQNARIAEETVRRNAEARKKAEARAEEAEAEIARFGLRALYNAEGRAEALEELLGEVLADAETRGYAEYPLIRRINAALLAKEDAE